MADQILVLTVIGDDRPGLVEQLSTAISTHQGNWLESSMSRLAGKFAGILKVSVPAEQAPALQQALAGLSLLKVTVESSPESQEAPKGRRLRLPAGFALSGQQVLIGEAQIHDPLLALQRPEAIAPFRVLVHDNLHGLSFLWGLSGCRASAPAVGWVA